MLKVLPGSPHFELFNIPDRRQRHPEYRKIVFGPDPTFRLSFIMTENLLQQCGDIPGVNTDGSMKQ